MRFCGLGDSRGWVRASRGGIAAGFSSFLVGSGRGGIRLPFETTDFSADVLALFFSLSFASVGGAGKAVDETAGVLRLCGDGRTGAVVAARPIENRSRGDQPCNSWQETRVGACGPVASSRPRRPDRRSFLEVDEPPSTSMSACPGPVFAVREWRRGPRLQVRCTRPRRFNGGRRCLKRQIVGVGTAECLLRRTAKPRGDSPAPGTAGPGFLAIVLAAKGRQLGRYRWANDVNNKAFQRLITGERRGVAASERRPAI